MDRQRHRTSHNAPEPSFPILLHRMPFRAQLTRAPDRESVTDELLRILERGIVCCHFDLGKYRHHVAAASRLSQSILQGLLQHVSNPPGRSRDENAERERSYFTPRLLIA